VVLADTRKAERRSSCGPDREITRALHGLHPEREGADAADRIEACERFRVAQGTLGDLSLSERSDDVSPIIAPFLVAREVWDDF